MVKLLIVTAVLFITGCIPVGTGWGYDISARNQLVINEREQAITELHEEIEAANEAAFSLSSYYPEGY